MKFVLLSLLCALLGSTGLAAPKITEIRLEDAPGFIAPPLPKNEFVFRADGHFYWTEGTVEKPVRHHYSIGEEAFQKLAATLDTHGFFELKPKYDRLKPNDPVLADGSTVVVSAMRDGLRKTVVDYSGFGPANLWELEMILRGFASQYTGLKRSPATTATAPAKRARDEPPVPIIRSTKKTQN